MTGGLTREEKLARGRAMLKAFKERGLCVRASLRASCVWASASCVRGVHFVSVCDENLHNSVKRRPIFALLARIDTP